MCLLEEWIDGARRLFIFIFFKLKERGFYMVNVLRKSIRQYKKLSLTSPVLVAGEALIEMLIPYLVGILIDKGIMKGNMAVSYTHLRAHET